MTFFLMCGDIAQKVIAEREADAATVDRMRLAYRRRKEAVEVRTAFLESAFLSKGA